MGTAAWPVLTGHNAAKAFSDRAQLLDDEATYLKDAGFREHRNEAGIMRNVDTLRCLAYEYRLMATRLEAA